MSYCLSRNRKAYHLVICNVRLVIHLYTIKDSLQEHVLGELILIDFTVIGKDLHSNVMSYPLVLFNGGGWKLCAFFTLNNVLMYLPATNKLKCMGQVRPFPY